MGITDFKLESKDTDFGQNQNGSVLGSLFSKWAWKSEVNILSRAGVCRSEWKPFLGRCLPAKFEEKPLCKLSNDAAGAATSAFSRLWSSIHGRLLDYFGVSRRPNSASRDRDKQML